MKIVRPSGLLLKIPDAPKRLYCYGDTSLLEKQCVTIVGTRDITEYGEKVLDMFLGSFLSELDIVVVSGMARGVDGYVHKKCLERGISTIAVLPGGIDTAVPFCNIEICKEIRKSNLLITEYPKGTKLNKYMYIQRNRILAGVSSSIIIIEAGENSGSLTTAKLALDYNREIYVVPGNITSPVSKGCNILAQQGANILSSLEDMKEIFGIVGEQVHFL